MSIGLKLGRGIGVVGALAVEGAVRGATGLGRFGEDVIAGAQEGFDEKHAALLKSRAEREVKLAAARAAAIAAHNATMLAVTPAVEPVPVATGKRAVKV
jgi:hypothetical protein